MATIKDVATMAGVSVTTVSRVINNTAPVNEMTKKNVLDAMKELKYTPSIIAQGMRTKKSRSVAVIIPDYINMFYNELFKGLHDEAKKAGYSVIIASVGYDSSDEISCINDLINRNIDGIIVCTYKGDKETIEYLLKVSKDLPVIFMDNFDIEKPINMVYVDGYEGIKQITNHLIAKGYRKIAFIKPIKRYKVANDRYNGYVDALKQSNISFNEDLIYEGDYRIESGYEAAKYLLSNSKMKPEAIVAANDMMAIGVIKYIKSKKIKIPEDIAVAGFDNIYFSTLISPTLTTYAQPIKELAEKAIKLFINKVKHPTTKNKKVVLKGKLIIRESTDNIKK
jgi:DNA-binding LacI/PurR family transcriptional regulator